jgi:hypothetical protein
VIVAASATAPAAASPSSRVVTSAPAITATTNDQ